MSAEVWNRPIVVVLGVICLLGVLVILSNLGAPGVPEIEALPGNEVASLEFAQMIEPKQRMPSAGTFSKMVERPLFRSTRRPAPKVVEAPPVVAEVVEAKPVVKPLTGYELVGVVLTPDVETGIIRKGQEEAIVILKGEEVEGWTLQSVSADRLLFENGATSAEIAFRDVEGSPDDSELASANSNTTEAKTAQHQPPQGKTGQPRPQAAGKHRTFTPIPQN